MGGLSLELTQFEPWEKIARLNRDIIVTEKIDGTNAAVVVMPLDEAEAWVRDTMGVGIIHSISPTANPFFATANGLAFAAQSRTRFITPGKSTDNHGFAQWVRDNAESLSSLGEGRHYGEWWGKGIQRGYGIVGKQFSLFNTVRWGAEHPACCQVVPVLYQGPYSQHAIAASMTTLRDGSFAAPGFKNPEGVVVYHTAARQMFKWTFVGDEAGKGQRADIVVHDEGEDAYLGHTDIRKVPT